MNQYAIDKSIEAQAQNEARRATPAFAEFDAARREHLQHGDLSASAATHNRYNGSKIDRLWSQVISENE